MKKIFLIILLVTCQLSLVGVALAHVLTVDKNIGVVLHIDPDDEPIIGKVSTFFFEIHDKTGKFKLSYCECIGSIVKSEKVIYKKNLSDNASFTYTFSKKGHYEVRLSGKPIKKDEFDSFEIEYPVAVSRIENAKQTTFSGNSIILWMGSHLYHLAAGIIIIVMGGIFAILRWRGKIQ